MGSKVTRWLCQPTHFCLPAVNVMNVNVNNFPDWCTYYFCCQGEVGVGVPGPRGERGDPGTRVRHRPPYCMTEGVMIGANTWVHCCILGRRGSSWLGWGERANGKTSRFVSYFICLFIMSRSLSAKAFVVSFIAVLFKRCNSPSRRHKWRSKSITLIFIIITVEELLFTRTECFFFL